MGYCLPFLSTPPLSNVPIPLPSYSPTSIKGAALEEVTLGLIAKGAVELAALPSPGFYSRLFVVWKTSGSWRSVIDLSHLNRFVDVSHFQMETIQSVLLSVRQGDCLASNRSQGSVSSSASSSCFSSLSSLHVPWHGLPVQGSVLWPLHGSAGLHQGHGSCFSYTSFSGYPYASIPRRLAGPVFLSGVSPRGSSDCPPTLSRVGDCHQPPEVQPHTFPGSSVSRGRHRLHLFQGFSIGGTHLTAAEFQSCASPTASLWLSLLGVLSSLAHLVPGGRLRMRSLQLCLHRSWNRQDLEAPVLVSRECLHDLRWWLHLPRLSLGVSLRQVSPDLHFWSDASDVGWGAHLDCQVASGLWDAQQAALSINARELLAVQLGLFQFRSALQGRMVAVFCDNTTAVAYLRK